MTNEEAIKWLKDIHHRFNPTGEKLENEGGDVHLQALDMAIEALKDVQNCVHCEHYTEVETNTGIHGECKMDTAHKVSEIPTGSDLISRQDALDILDEFESDIELGEKDSYKTNREKLLSLSSAEPKTGHAETASSGVLSPTVWAVCSECKKPIDLWDNYCRSCGARMDGGEEE